MVSQLTKEELIAALNRDLELEYAAAIQYIQHAAVITGAQFSDVQKEIILHSQQEMQHALSLSTQIDFLGGVPTVGVGPISTSPDSMEMLKADLAGEEDAVNRYRMRIEQAEQLKEYGLRRILEDILIMEEEHKRDLMAVVYDSKKA